jgi:hypothetical protein
MIGFVIPKRFPRLLKQGQPFWSIGGLGEIHVRFTGFTQHMTGIGGKGCTESGSSIPMYSVRVAQQASKALTMYYSTLT